MTITAADLVTRAFRRLGIKAEDEALSADQAAHGLDTLNDMLAGWRSQGVNFVHSRMRPDDPFGGSDEIVAPTVSLLAAELAPDYGVPISWDADRALRVLQAALMPTVQPLTVDSALTRPLAGYGWRR